MASNFEQTIFFALGMHYVYVLGAVYLQTSKTFAKTLSLNRTRYTMAINFQFNSLSTSVSVRFEFVQLTSNEKG